MVKLVNTTDLKSVAVRLVDSISTTRTNFPKNTPIAQWQSMALIKLGLLVRIQLGVLNFK